MQRSGGWTVQGSARIGSGLSKEAGVAGAEEWMGRVGDEIREVG